MTWFSSRNVSLSTVPAEVDAIWDLITDPDMLAELTPLVTSIEADGSLWTWALAGIEGLGVKIEASFTERMTFTERSQIVFAHEPAAGSKERAAVEGVYDLEPDGNDATRLRVDLTLKVDLPLPRLSRKAVEGVMGSTMRLTGQKFAENLYEHLGLDPATVDITEQGFD